MIAASCVAIVTRAELISVDPGCGGCLMAARVIIEREGGDKAACVVDTVSVLVP
ncbi:hypothetical protein [Kribbella speibonae]|uniref:hypothetical protein n=1 Tax=Kribbella speibonae TaxID=1572660 RepID=UPI001EDFF004|nr:hypothetical protein [Kribbella speibonae]